MDGDRAVCGAPAIPGNGIGYKSWRFDIAWHALYVHSVSEGPSRVSWSRIQVLPVLADQW